MNKDNAQQLFADYKIYNLQEAKSYHLILGLILLTTFIGMISVNVLTIPTYTIGLWSFILLSYKYWPSFIYKIDYLIFYLLILGSFSLICHLALLNNFSWSWGYINGLICFIVIVSFINWLVFLGMIFLSFSIALLFSSYTQAYYSANFITENLELWVRAIIPVLIIILIWRHKNQIETRNDEKNAEISNVLNDDLARQTKIRISELETALVLKTDFLNNMSHEIRTPIQGFTALSEGLVTHWNTFSEEKKLDLAFQVSNNARRLATLVTNLLDFSKFTADKMIIDFQSFNFNAVIEDIIAECNELYLADKKITIQFIPCENDSISADRNRIEQVLRNLFVNAIKFSPNHSTIKISLFHPKADNTNGFHFIISDEGPGIPETEINSIFDPFIQSSRTRSKGGTGLGLSISKKIIEAHNGQIWAENNQEIGASFHFIIPNFQIIEENFNTDTPHHYIRILMVDDEEICLSSMELLLTNTPYTLIKATSGKEAMEYLKNHPDSVDIILLDLMMPDVYGLNVLEIIKKDPQLKHIPVILQSGTSDKAEIHKAYSMGIFSYISKPYKRNIILAEVSKAIDYYAQNTIN